MTFYIPPVFLFGNNANRFHNNEEEKSEYKTAAETEIKVGNWRAKRIVELEEENKKLKEEIKKLKEDVDFFYKSAKQFREDAESWRKEAELLLGIEIFGKTLAERIDDDKKVVRE